MRTLVLGIGNPILGDDGVGVHVAEEVARRIQDEEIDIEDASTSGLNLLDLIVGYEKVVIIDAIMTEGGVPGTIYRLRPEDFTRSVHPGTPMHGLNFPTVLEIGKKLMPAEMPREIVIFAVEVKEIETFTEEMTPEVQAAVPRVVELVLGEISKK